MIRLIRINLSNSHRSSRLPLIDPITLITITITIILIILVGHLLGDRTTDFIHQTTNDPLDSFDRDPPLLSTKTTSIQDRACYPVTNHDPHHDHPLIIPSPDHDDPKLGPLGTPTGSSDPQLGFQIISTPSTASQERSKTSNHNNINQSSSKLIGRQDDHEDPLMIPSSSQNNDFLHPSTSRDRDRNIPRGDGGRTTKKNHLERSIVIRFISSFFSPSKNPIWSFGLKISKTLLTLFLSIIHSFLTRSASFLAHVLVWCWDEIIFPATFPIRMAYWLTISKPWSLLKWMLHKLKPLMIYLISAIMMGILIGRAGWTTQVYIGNRLFPLKNKKKEKVGRSSSSSVLIKDSIIHNTAERDLRRRQSKRIDPKLDSSTGTSSFGKKPIHQDRVDPGRGPRPKLKPEGKKKKRGVLRNQAADNLVSMSSSSSSSSSPSWSDQAKEEDWGSWTPPRLPSSSSSSSSPSSSSSSFEGMETELTSEIKPHQSRFTSARESEDGVHLTSPRHRRSSPLDPPPGSGSGSAPSSSSILHPPPAHSPTSSPSNSILKPQLNRHHPPPTDPPLPSAPLQLTRVKNETADDHPPPSSASIDHHHHPKKKVTFKSD